ncbi:hypothetical protein [Pseudonocardia hierapolitana]|uniref:hypothetical protein n=1 Tax=Pseudonocardia hierapolitana TaxID=1128676 RepID=UPI0011BEE2B2|nr:hypothetical protein [Pseudonocardia hierapolitana]
MKIGWRDGVATLLVAAIVVPYIGYLLRGSMPFIQDPRGMAVTGLVLGVAAAAAVGRAAFRGTWGAIAAFFAVASGAVGIVTFIRADEGALSEGLLAVFMTALVVAWVLAELVRTHVPLTVPLTRAGRSTH